MLLRAQVSEQRAISEGLTLLTRRVTSQSVIRSFHDKDTEAVSYHRHVKKLRPELSRPTYDKLGRIA